MKSKMLVVVAHDELSSEAYLRKVGVLRTFDLCPDCRGDRLVKKGRCNYRCKDCRHVWGLRTGSPLQRSKVSCQDFLLMASNFVREMPAMTCAEDLELSRNTVSQYYTMFREALDLHVREQQSQSPESEKGQLDEQSEKGCECGSDARVPTLWIREPSGNPGVNGIEGYRSFAQQRLQKFHGISRKFLPLYLKEMEVRYNHRGDDLFALVMVNFANPKLWDL